MAATPTEARWSALIDQQEASNQTIRAFAEAHGVNPNTLSWWRKRLGRTRPRRKPKPKPRPFVEVVVDDSGAKAGSRGLVLQLHDGCAQLEVDDRTDLVLLRRVLAALC